jgi:hypothetical protein
VNGHTTRKASTKLLHAKQVENGHKVAMSSFGGFDYATFGIVSIGYGREICWVCGGCPWIVNPLNFSPCCSNSNHLVVVDAFLTLAVNHPKEIRIAATDWFEPYIRKLRLDRDKYEMQSMFFHYLYTADRESPPVLRNAVLRLAWMKKVEPLVSFILGVWKNLAKSRAGDQIVDSGPLKTLWAVVDIYNAHCDDWKVYKKEVLDAGQVQLVEMLVRPFWGESPLHPRRFSRSNQRSVRVMDYIED